MVVLVVIVVVVCVWCGDAVVVVVGGGGGVCVFDHVSVACHGVVVVWKSLCVRPFVCVVWHVYARVPVVSIAFIHTQQFNTHVPA